jgi:biliverdin reductase
VQQALEAGKHVLCDYPLALSGFQARALFELAHQRRRVLHVEHIGLLTVAHRKAKETLRPLGHLVWGEFIFTGGWSEKLVGTDRHGPFPFIAESRLMQIADLFGAFTVVKSEWSVQPAEARLHLQLRIVHGGGLLDFVEYRQPDAPRKRRMKARMERGAFTWPDESEPTGLFAKDLEAFFAQVREGAASYVDRDLMFLVLDALERV